MNITNIKENMGNADRIVRAIAAVIFVASFFNGITSGVAGLLSLAVAIYFLVTAIFGLCGLYSLVGLSTQGKRTARKQATPEFNRTYELSKTSMA